MEPNSSILRSGETEREKESRRTGGSGEVDRFGSRVMPREKGGSDPQRSGSRDGLGDSDLRVVVEAVRANRWTRCANGWDSLGSL